MTNDRPVFSHPCFTPQELADWEIWEKSQLSKPLTWEEEQALKCTGKCNIQQVTTDAICTTCNRLFE